MKNEQDCIKKFVPMSQLPHNTEVYFSNNGKKEFEVYCTICQGLITAFTTLYDQVGVVQAQEHSQQHSILPQLTALYEQH